MMLLGCMLLCLLLLAYAVALSRQDVVSYRYEDLCVASSLNFDGHSSFFETKAHASATFASRSSSNLFAVVAYQCGQYHADISNNAESRRLAIEFYKLSLSIDPSLMESYLNLGYAYDLVGDEYNSLLVYFQCIEARNLMGTWTDGASNVTNDKLLRDLITAECIANIVNKEIWNEFGVKSRRHVAAVMRLIAFSLTLYKSDSYGSYNQIGLILTNQGNFNLAHHYFQKSLKINPTNYMAWLNTGNHFFRLNRFDQAVDAFKSTIFVSEIQDKLGSIFVLNNMGQSFREMGRLQESLNSFSVAIVLLFNPKHEVFRTLNDELFHLNINSTWDNLDINIAKFIVSSALSNRKEEIKGDLEGRLGGGYGLGEMIKNSVVKLEYPSTNQPTAMLMRSLLWSLSNAIAVQGLSCLWNQLEFLEELLIKSVNLNFEYFYEQRVNTLVDPYTVSLLRFSPANFDLKISYLSCLYSPQFEFSSLKYKEFLNSNVTGAVIDAAVLSFSRLKIKIGFLSYDWRDHPMGRLTYHLVTKPYLRSDSRFEYEIFCITYSDDDGSPVYAYVKSHCENFLDFREAESHNIIDRIKSLELDVLVDLTVHTYRGRVDISAAKPAQLVINYLGYAGSSGCVGFDYVLLNDIAAPADTGTASGFSEKIVYLPYSYQTNHMPWDAIPCSDAAKCRERLTFVKPKPRSDIGVDTNIDINKHGEVTGKKRDIYAEDIRWICSFNAKQKFDPLVVSSWTNILHNIPNSILILVEFDDAFKLNLIRVIKYFGILESRVQFIPRVEWEAHLHRASSCDFLLDTFIYGAHTTSSDVLWIWEPILTLDGFGTNHIPSRIPTSIISRLDDSTTLHSRETKSDKSKRVEPSHLTVAYSIKEYENIANRMSDVILFQLKRLIARNTFFSLVFSSYHMEKTVYKSLQATISAYSIGGQDRRYHLSMDIDGFKERDIFELNCDRSKQVILAHNESKSDDGLDNLHLTVLGIPWRCVPHLQFNRIVNISSIARKSPNMHMQALGVQDVTDSISIYAMMQPRIKVYRDILIKLSSFRLDNFSGSTGTKTSKMKDTVYRRSRYSDFVHSYSNSNKIVEDLHVATIAAIDYYLSRESCATAFPLFDKLVTSYFEVEKDYSDSDNDNNVTLVGAISEISSKICMFYKEPHDITFVDDNARLLFDIYCQGRYKGSQRIVNILHTDKTFRLGLWRPYSSLKSQFNVYIPRVLILHPQNFYINNPNLFLELMQKVSLLYSETHICQKYSTSVVSSFHLWLLSYQVYPHHQNILVGSIFFGDMKLNELSIMMIYEYSLRRQSSDMQPGGTVKDEYLQMRQELSYEPTTTFDDIGETQRKSREGFHRRSLLIVIYCFQYGQNWWPRWGKSSAEDGQGMGGSEEAVVFLSEHLARKGHRVIVYGDPPDKDLNTRYMYPVSAIDDQHSDLLHDCNNSGSVTWKNFDQFNISENIYIDVYVAWRYAHNLMLGSNAKMRFLWLHDLIPLTDFPGYLFRQTDVILTQSQFHSDFIVRGLKLDSLPSLEILPNAVHLQDSTYNNHSGSIKNKNIDNDTYNGNNSGNNNDVFVYASAPNRGLEHILSIWSSIKLHFPRASLRIYYGFNSAVNERLASLMGREEFDRWYPKMTQLLQQDGIDYRGSVDHNSLWEGISTSGFLLYPSTFPETGCITVMRAMLLGAIPITSRYVESALFNLTLEHDLGPPPEEALEGSVISNQTALKAWVDETFLGALLTLKRRSTEDIERHRKRMVQYAKAKFTWSASADKFEKLALERL